MKRKRSWFLSPTHTHIFCMTISQSVSYFFFQYILFFIIYCINKIKTKKCRLCKFCQNTKHFSFFPLLFSSFFFFSLLRYKKNSSTPSHVYKILINIEKWHDVKGTSTENSIFNPSSNLCLFVFLPKFKEKHKTMPWRVGIGHNTTDCYVFFVQLIKSLCFI